MRKIESEAENAGYEAGRYGANTANCHFTYFATPELTKAWVRGNARGLSAGDTVTARKEME